MHRPGVVSISAASLLLACGSASDTNAGATANAARSGGTAHASGDKGATARADPPMYLALGDSIAMGFNPFVDAHNAQAYVGYPEYLQDLIDIPHTNAGCYGETTSSFLNVNAQDRGCRDLKRDGLVRAGYRGTQMDFMIDFIQNHARLELITFALGPNDMLITIETCTDEYPQDPAPCIQEALPGVFETMTNNLVTIFWTIRDYLGYKGRIVVPLYYDAFPTLSPGWTQLLGVNNSILTQVAGYFGAQVVDVNSAFAAASASAAGDPCAAGLLIPLTGWNQWVTTVPSANCDGHTSPVGARLVADTIAQVVPLLAE